MEQGDKLTGEARQGKWSWLQHELHEVMEPMKAAIAAVTEWGHHFLLHDAKEVRTLLGDAECTAGSQKIIDQLSTPLDNLEKAVKGKQAIARTRNSHSIAPVNAGSSTHAKAAKAKHVKKTVRE